MKSDVVKKLKTIDPQVFTAIMRQLGFATAACYRGVGEKLVLIIKSEQEKPAEWPAVVPCHIHYTLSEQESAAIGWVRASDFQTDRYQWKKGIYLYFPEQFFSDEKVVFAVTCSSGKRIRSAELDGVLEAVSSRLRGMFARESEVRNVHEEYLRDRVAEMDSDVQALVDHELRTPLASLSGYLSILRESPSEQDDVEEYWQIVETKLLHIVDTMDRLSMALHGRKEKPTIAMNAIDVRSVVDSQIAELVAHAREHVSEQIAEKLYIQVLQDEHSSCQVFAEDKMFRWATWEVLKNAIVYSKTGKVDVAIYKVNETVVIDVIDDGGGVSPGTEELIFLRFFQEPGKQRTRKGKRGLGLGLYLARQIVQRHAGELLYLRSKSSTIFRFIWPGSRSVLGYDEKQGA